MVLTVKLERGLRTLCWSDGLYTSRGWLRKSTRLAHLRSSCGANIGLRWRWRRWVSQSRRAKPEGDCGVVWVTHCLYSERKTPYWFNKNFQRYVCYQNWGATRALRDRFLPAKIFLVKNSGEIRLKWRRFLVAHLLHHIQISAAEKVHSRPMLVLLVRHDLLACTANVHSCRLVARFSPSSVSVPPLFAMMLQRSAGFVETRQRRDSFFKWNLNSDKTSSIQSVSL